MPLHPDRPGLKCHVYCNGWALEEYDAPAHDAVKPLTVVKYIVAQEEVEYLAHVEFVEPFPHNTAVTVRTYVDGKPYSGTVINKPAGKSLSALGFEWFNGVVWKLRRFRFARTSIAENGPRHLSPTLRKQLNSAGTIRVKLSWFKKTGESSPSSKDGTFDLMGDLPKKAILEDYKSHQTLLGEPERSTKGCNCVYHGHSFKCAVFEFRYRSHSQILALVGNIQEQQSRPGWVSRGFGSTYPWPKC